MRIALPLGMFRMFLTFVLSLSVWMGALSAQAPHLPQAYAEEICDAHCQALIDDPQQRSIVDRLVHWVREALDHGHACIADLFRILHDLFAYLVSIGDQIHQQIASSECRNRSCTQTGGHP